MQGIKTLLIKTFILLKLIQIKSKSTCHYWEIIQLDERLLEFSVVQLEVIQLHTAAVYSYPYSLPIQLPHNLQSSHPAYYPVADKGSSPAG